jgi:hypothetical protein
MDVAVAGGAIAPPGAALVLRFIRLTERRNNLF